MNEVKKIFAIHYTELITYEEEFEAEGLLDARRIFYTSMMADKLHPTECSVIEYTVDEII